MDIGIIGSGRLGSTLGSLWASLGHRVLFSYSRDPGKLDLIARAAGSTAVVGTPRDAARFGRVTLLATPWHCVADALLVAGATAGSLDGSILIDCTNPWNPDRTLAIGHTTSAAEEVAKRVPGARVVKAFNTLGAACYRNPIIDGQQASTFVASDDAEAKDVATELAAELGLHVVDAGPLASARLLEPLALLLVQIRAAETPMAQHVAFRLLRSAGFEPERIASAAS